MKTSNEVRDDNKMLRFQVEQLWCHLKNYQTRMEQTVHALRESNEVKRATIDELKEEIAKLKDRLGPPIVGTPVCDVEPEPEPPWMSMYEKCDRYRDALMSVSGPLGQIECIAVSSCPPGAAHEALLQIVMIQNSIYHALQDITPAATPMVDPLVEAKRVGLRQESVIPGKN